MSSDATPLEKPPQTAHAAAVADDEASLPKAPAWFRNAVIRRPGLTMLALLLVLGGVAAFVPRFELDASADSLLLEDDPDLRQLREVNRRYGSQDLLLVTFTPDDDLFSDSSLARLGALRDDLAEVPSVASITSILDAPLLESSDVPLTEMTSNVQTVLTPGVDRGQARKELTTSPVFRELIISADGRTTALALNLVTDDELAKLLSAREELRDLRRTRGLNAEESARLTSVSREYEAAYDRASARLHLDIDRIRQVVAQYAPYGELDIGGVSMIADDMIAFVQSDLIIFGAGVLAFVVLVLAIIFRELRWVVLPLASCMFAAIFMIGLLGLMDWEVTVISSNFLALMLIVTISMNIHLVVRYRQLSRRHPRALHTDLVEATLCLMVWPCLYTALTTILGFGSLVVSDIKPVQDFGWMMCAGLSVAFATSFSLFPAMLLLLGRPGDGGGDEAEPALLARLASWSEHHGGAILAVSAVLAVGSALGIARLTVENSFIDYFREDTEIYQGMKLIDEQLGGTTPLDILLDFDANDVAAAARADEPAVPGDAAADDADDDFDYDFGTSGPQYWFTDTRIERIKKVQDYLAGLPEVGKVLSLASLIRVAEGLNGGQPLDSVEIGVLYNRLPEEIRASIVDPYFDYEANEARVQLRIRDFEPGLRRNELVSRIRSDLSQMDLGTTRTSLVGTLVLYNNLLQSLVESQIASFAAVLLGVALMFYVLFRSLRLALIGILPNVLAAACVLGLMGWMRIPLDIMTITIAAIAIGIAVDNAIHYIYRFREELAHNGDYIATLHICHSTMGRAVLYTSLTIIFGFSILVFSNFFPTIYFGTLTGLAIAIALLAALTLLPRLILLARPFGPAGPSAPR